MQYHLPGLLILFTSYTIFHTSHHSCVKFPQLHFTHPNIFIKLHHLHITSSTPTPQPILHPQTLNYTTLHPVTPQSQYIATLHSNTQQTQHDFAHADIKSVLLHQTFQRRMSMYTNNGSSRTSIRKVVRGKTATKVFDQAECHHGNRLRKKYSNNLEIGVISVLLSRERRGAKEREVKFSGYIFDTVPEVYKKLRKKGNGNPCS